MKWLRGIFSRPSPGDPALGVKLTKEDQQRLPVDRDPADALGIELRLASDHLIERRRLEIRRFEFAKRTTAMIGGGALLLAVTTGGAHALGVRLPVVTGVADHPIENGKISAERPDIEQPHTLPRVSDEPNSAGDLLHIPFGTSPKKELVGSTFLTVDGQTCFAWTLQTQEGPTDKVQVSACRPLTLVLSSLSQDRGFPPHIDVVGTTGLVVAYLPPEVSTVTASGPFGKMEVALTDAWSPDFFQIPRFRTLVAVRELKVARDGLDAKELHQIHYVTNYEIEARDEDGRVLDTSLR